MRISNRLFAEEEMTFSVQGVYDSSDIKNFTFFCNESEIRTSNL